MVNLNKEDKLFLEQFSLGGLFGGFVWILFNDIKRSWSMVFAVLLVFQVFLLMYPTIQNVTRIYDNLFSDLDVINGNLYYKGFEVVKSFEPAFSEQTLILFLIGVIVLFVPSIYLGKNGREIVFTETKPSSFDEFKNMQKKQDVVITWSVIGILSVFVIINFFTDNLFPLY